MNGIQIFKFAFKRALYNQKQKINLLYDDLFLSLVRNRSHLGLYDNFRKLSECKRKRVINLLKISELRHKKDSHDLYTRSEWDESIDYGFNDCRKIASVNDHVCCREADVSFYLRNSFTNPMSSYIREE